MLIVDDDPDMRLYLRGCLETLGSRVARVVEAADGLSALRLARTGDVHVVISDVFLPVMNGGALCDAIHADTNLRDIRVLLISGEDQARSTEGADGFLAKPFNARQLLAALDRLLPPARSPPEQ